MAHPSISHWTWPPSPQAPGWKAQGWYRTCPSAVSQQGAGKRTPVPWSYLLLAKLLPALPSSSQQAQQKWSFGILSCLQADDLVLEVKGSQQRFLWSEIFGEGSFSLSAHQQWQCGSYRVCSVTGQGQGLLHEEESEEESCMNCKLRSSCRNLPPSSAASAQYSQLEGLYLCNCIRSHITVNCPYCLQ